MNTRISLIALLLFAVTALASAQKIRVVATTPDLADLTRRIGGDDVEVVSLTRGDEDLHLVQILPSMLTHLRKADVLVEMGLDLEHAWLPMLVKRARNPKIEPGTRGFVNCSSVIRVRPARTQGQGVHLHPLGNPHWNVDPVAMGAVAGRIEKALSAARPDLAERFEKNARAFQSLLDEKMKKWTEALEPKKGAFFVEYHETWGYFADRFGLNIVGQLEPRPGIPPTAAHLADMARSGKSSHCGLVVGRPAWSQAIEKTAEMMEAKALTIQPMSSRDQEGGWIAFMDEVVAEFAAALKTVPRSE